MTDGGINWAELARRHEDSDDADFEIIETRKAGVKAARSLRHPLLRYAASGTITGRQYDAGHKLLGDWLGSQSSFSAMQFDGSPQPTSFSSGSITDRQLDASKAYNAALDAIGPRVSLVITDIIIWEITAERHGKCVKQNRFQAVGSLKMSLDILADYYRMGRE